MQQLWYDIDLIAYLFILEVRSQRFVESISTPLLDILIYLSVSVKTEPTLNFRHLLILR